MANLTQYAQVRSFFPAVKTVLGTALGVVVIYLLFKRINPLLVVDEFKQINYVKLTFATIAVILSYIFRALMWRKLLCSFHNYSYWSAFRSTMMGYLINNLVPARLGDLFRGVWLYRSQGGSRSFVLGTLVLERVLDVSLVLVILNISLISLSVIQDWILWTIFSLITGIVCFFIGASLLVILCQRAKTGFPAWVYLIKEKLIYINKFSLKKYLDRIMHIGNSMNLTNARRGLVWSIITWFVTFWGLYFTLQSLGSSYNVGLLRTGLILSIASLGVAVPSMPASLGTYQAAFVFGAIMAGLPEPKALSAAILYHGLWIVVTSILGLISLIWEGMRIRDLFAKIKKLNEFNS